MSEVAGRMAVQAAAHHLESPAGGAGILLGGVPGTPAAKVLIIGGGVSGTEAAKIALGMRAIVRVLDTNPGRLAYLSDIFGGRLDLVVPNRARTAAYVAEADVVIGAVLVPGAKAPKLVSREMIAAMRPGSVVVDIAIDQGGCFETSRPTTHSDPTYVEEGVTHYCVANIPGAVARTSTLALTSATLPYLVTVARHGVAGAAEADPALGLGPEHARREPRQPARRRGARPAVLRPGRTARHALTQRRRVECPAGSRQRSASPAGDPAARLPARHQRHRRARHAFIWRTPYVKVGRAKRFRDCLSAGSGADVAGSTRPCAMSRPNRRFTSRPGLVWIVRVSEGGLGHESVAPLRQARAHATDITNGVADRLQRVPDNRRHQVGDAHVLAELVRLWIGAARASTSRGRARLEDPGDLRGHGRPVDPPRWR